MASSTAASFVVALRSQLQARPGLAGVNVYLVAPVDTDQTEFILLLRGRVRGEREWAALGRMRREEAFSVPCLIRVRRTFDGDDDATVFQAVWDRAEALFTEVDQQLRDSPPAVGAQTIEARATDLEEVPLVEPAAWIVDYEFSVTFRARVS